MKQNNFLIKQLEPKPSSPKSYCNVCLSYYEEYLEVK